MIYKIDNKFYIKVQGYYKGVDIKFNGDDLDLKPNGDDLEVYNVQEKVTPIDVATTGKDEIKALLNVKENKKDNKDLSFGKENGRNSRI